MKTIELTISEYNKLRVILNKLHIWFDHSVKNKIVYLIADAIVLVNLGF